METGNQPAAGPAQPAETGVAPALASEPTAELQEAPYRGLRWIFLGSQGLRAGWSVLIFAAIFLILNIGIDAALFKAHLLSQEAAFSPKSAFFGELGSFLAMLGAAAVVALIERRRILDYNLSGPHRRRHFFFGLAAGILALSALIGALTTGGWLHFGPVALSGAAIFRFGALWGCTFLLSGFVEEGLFRCYGLFTLTRGINFWWALGLVAAMCADLSLRVRGNGVWGVYVVALLGLAPCFVLHQRSAPRSSAFWLAAWVTSTFFGYLHVGNGGENWIGIFAASLIGFVFCVSVRLTGSAWWAIGCHAGWDWAETFFYGAADSGLPAQGHYLTSMPAGNPLWSGGTDGPEGSLLVLGVILLLLLLLLSLYGRGKRNMPEAPATEPSPA
jgi:hypothetical protein